MARVFPGLVAHIMGYAEEQMHAALGEAYVSEDDIAAIRVVVEQAVSNAVDRRRRGSEGVSTNADQ